MKIDTPAESLLDGDDLALARTNQALESMTAQERVCWAYAEIAGATGSYFQLRSRAR